MPFVTELAIPSEAATDPNIPAFVSLHTCDFDAAHYGTRFIFAIETGHCEDDLLDMLCEDANGLRAGRLASNEHNMEYFTSLHIGDREGRTALHHAVRRGHHKLVLRILELNKQFYNDPMKDFDSEEHFGTSSILSLHRLEYVRSAGYAIGDSLTRAIGKPSFQTGRI